MKRRCSSDTFVKGKGSTVAKVIDGSLHGYRRTGMAGVANIGADRNWTGSQFDQANWYAFGRLAWNPTLGSAGHRRRMGADDVLERRGVRQPVVQMMMGSREAVVDYMTPLGLHHLMGRGYHYGPGPWVAGGRRADWTSVYYHRADASGIGFDRIAHGQQRGRAVLRREWRSSSAIVKNVPEKYLLWFHHVPWDHRMPSGRTLWDELVVRYTRGVEIVHGMRKTWAGLDAYVDAERHEEVAAFLAIQEKEAKWWRDACIAYFQTFSKRPLPAGYAPPERTLAEYEAMAFPMRRGCRPRIRGRERHTGFRADGELACARAPDIRCRHDPERGVAASPSTAVSTITPCSSATNPFACGAGPTRAKAVDCLDRGQRRDWRVRMRAGRWIATLPAMQAGRPARARGAHASRRTSSCRATFSSAMSGCAPASPTWCCRSIARSIRVPRSRAPRTIGSAC